MEKGLSQQVIVSAL